MAVFPLTVPQRNSVLNSTVTSSVAVALPNEHAITSVQPFFNGAGAVPRGRIFVSVEVVDKAQWDATATLVLHSTAWRGYLYTPGVRASKPMATYPPGSGVILRVTQTGQGTVRGVSAMVHTAPVSADEAMAAGASMVDEDPGSGVGELVATGIAAPGVAADYGTVLTVAARERVRVAGWSGGLVASAVVGNRMLIGTFNRGGSDLRSFYGTQFGTAGVTWTHRGAVGCAPSPASGRLIAVYIPPDMVGEPADILTVGDAAGLLAGDQFNAATLLTERWAIPA